MTSRIQSLAINEGLYTPSRNTSFGVAPEGEDHYIAEPHEFGNYREGRLDHSLVNQKSLYSPGYLTCGIIPRVVFPR